MLDIEFLYALRRGMLHFLAMFALLCGALLFPAPFSLADNPPANGGSFKGEDFFHNHGAVMLLIDPDSGAILDANQAAVRFYGYGHEKLISMNIQDINPLSPEEVAAEMALAREQLRNHFVFRHRPADGRERHVEVTSWPVTYQGQRALFSIVHDITGRIQAEEALRAEQANLESLVDEITRELRQAHRITNSTLLLALAVLAVVTVFLFRGLRRSAESRNALRQKSSLLASLLDSIPDLIFFKDVNGVYIRCNTEFARHVGRAEEEIVGRTDYDIYPPEEADAFRENDRLMLERQGPRHNEEWVGYPDGRRVLLDTLKTPFYDPDGVVIGIIGISRDITERKRMEESLRTSEQRLASVLETQQEMICRFQPDTTLTFVNEAYCRLFGKTSEELVGRPFLDLVPESEHDAIRATVGALSAGNPSQHYTHQVIGGDGRIAWQEWTDRVILDSRGAVLEIQSVGRDVTERMLAEQALRDKGEELERYFTSSLDLLCIANVNGEFVRLNPEWERVLGYPVSELEGRRFLDFVHPEDVEATLEALGKLNDQEQVQSFENRYLDRQGGYRWIEWRSIPQDELIYAAARDVTDRHNALAALRESEERMQALIRSIPDLVFVLDENLVFQDYHQPVSDRLLAAPEHFVGRAFETIAFPEPARTEILEALRATLRTGEPSRTEYWLDMPRGRFRYDMLVTPYRTAKSDSGGHAHGLTVVVRDITERYAMEQALRRSGEELARSNAELEQFAYAVSHDMRQPLRMVGSYLQILEKDLADLLTEETREYMGFAVDGARRMDAMILGLLDYSRVGRKTDPKAWVNSRESLDEALSFLRPAIQESGAEVRIAGDWPRIFASRDELTRLFQNLVGNAVKYRVPERPPVVDVTVREQDHDWLFRVRDNGVGVTPGQEDRLFKVFSRLHTRGRYEGTGIGLALCRKIVEHHQGRIWVESEGEGQGSVFCFTLPKMDDVEG
ncbi:PAS domain-containing sensor histidine kinase [Desulfonatronum thioautotrophicum]|uniref:PAS domain-containing sensor histidine kinase n=1 Tax=Desulfonatronum thioautotrophicum TaxID=617001 RepID=UPI00069A7C09|nr:PAS domain S-box protein [Desulfonatronum thioautotrophicum]